MRSITTKLSPLGHAAVKYARQGWRVFPLHPKGKTPLVKNGFHAATNNVKQVRAWWTEHPQANIGIACSSEHGPIVLDVDGPSGHRLLRRMNLPDTLTAVSRKGKLHLYFDPMKGGAQIKRAIRPFKKNDGKTTIMLDVLGDGGYVVAPPSVHPETGRPYQWQPDHRIARLPKHFLGFLHKQGGNGQSAPPLPDIIDEGERDNMLTSLAGSMRRRNSSPAAILAALRVENEARVRPPLPDEDLQRIAGSIGDKPAATNGKRPVGKMHVEKLSDVESKPVTWLWPNWLPLGQVIVLDGLPGQGKSAVTLNIAARGSRGWKMPDGSRGSVKGPWNTVILTYEDDAARTVRPRIDAAKGDPERIRHVTGITSPGSDDLLPPSLPEDLDALEQVLKGQPSTRLVIIDPLMSALGREIDSHRDQDIRRVLSRLARIAAKRNVCVLIVRHVRKATGNNAITAGGGSIGIIAQARCGWLIDRHPDKPDQSVLACAKSNLGAIPPSLAFRKVGVTVETASQGLIDTLGLRWKSGDAKFSADELLARREEGSTGDDGNAVKDWLREVLSDGQVDRREILKAARGEGYAVRTVDRAATRIGVVKLRSGSGADRRSHWSLVKDNAP